MIRKHSLQTLSTNYTYHTLLDKRARIYVILCFSLKSTLTLSFHILLKEATKKNLIDQCSDTCKVYLKVNKYEYVLLLNTERSGANYVYNGVHCEEKPLTV